METVNNMFSGAMNQPATVNKMFTIVNTRLSVKKKKLATGTWGPHSQP